MNMKTVSIRCHDADVKIIGEICEKRGITVSELIRDLIRTQKRKDETLGLLHSIKSDLQNFKEKGEDGKILTKILHYILISSFQIDDYMKISLGPEKYGDLTKRVKHRAQNEK